MVNQALRQRDRIFGPRSGVLGLVGRIQRHLSVGRRDTSACDSVREKQLKWREVLPWHEDTQSMR